MRTEGEKRALSSWRSMLRRCLNPDDASFVHYGQRGIQVHRPWMDSFDAFLGDMGERPAGMSIDRIDNDGDYVPWNCRWATVVQQAANRREGCAATQRRWCESLTLTDTQWAKLYSVALTIGALDCDGKPSWRVMCARIATGELVVTPNPKKRP